MTKFKKHSYWVWVVAACVVWAIALLVNWRLISSDSFHNLLIFFGGWAFGVLGASIARRVYK